MFLHDISVLNELQNDSFISSIPHIVFIVEKFYSFFITSYAYCIVTNNIMLQNEKENFFFALCQCNVLLMLTLKKRNNVAHSLSAINITNSKNSTLAF